MVPASEPQANDAAAPRMTHPDSLLGLEKAVEPRNVVRLGSVVQRLGANCAKCMCCRPASETFSEIQRQISQSWLHPQESTGGTAAEDFVHSKRRSCPLSLGCFLTSVRIFQGRMVETVSRLLDFPDKVKAFG